MRKSTIEELPHGPKHHPIGRIVIADAVIRRLKAGEVEIGSLKVRELEVGGRRWPEPGAGV